MAHRPSGPGRIRRRFRAGPAAAAGAGAVVVMVALAVGISQATASPACASVITPATDITGAGAPDAGLAGARTGTQTSGEATHYELAAGGMGNCSYPSPPAGQLYVALPPSEYGAAAACGSYLQVSGPDGSVTVEVVDQCPECQAGHIDLSEQAFARIAPLSAGLVPVSYHTIADPPLPAPLSMLVKTGSSAYYLALLPINNGNPLASVAVRQDSGGWQELARTGPPPARPRPGSSASPGHPPQPPRPPPRPATRAAGADQAVSGRLSGAGWSQPGSSPRVAGRFSRPASVTRTTRRRSVRRTQPSANSRSARAVPSGPARWWRCSDQSRQYRTAGWQASTASRSTPIPPSAASPRGVSR
jgi:expansin